MGGKRTLNVRISNMGKLRQSAATLGFYGDDLDPDEITMLFGTTPTVGVVKGGRWITSTGFEKIAYTGSWRINAEYSEPEDLNRQIKDLLAPLTSDLTIWHDLTRRYRLVMFCGLWLSTFNDGLELSPQSLGLLAARGLILDLDIYRGAPT